MPEIRFVEMYTCPMAREGDNHIYIVAQADRTDGDVRIECLTGVSHSVSHDVKRACGNLVNWRVKQNILYACGANRNQHMRVTTTPSYELSSTCTHRDDEMTL